MIQGLQNYALLLATDTTHLKELYLAKNLQKALGKWALRKRDTADRYVHDLIPLSFSCDQRGSRDDGDPRESQLEGVSTALEAATATIVGTDTDAPSASL